MQNSFLVRLSAFCLGAGLLFLAITAASAMVFGSPEAFKSALKGSGAYDTAADSLSKTVSSDVTKQLDQATGNQSISKAAKESLNPQALETSTEGNIDGFYGWLEGTTQRPEIKLDLKPYISKFTDSLSQEAGAKAEGLKACTPEQLKELAAKQQAGTTPDVFNLPCLPPGLNVGTAKQQAIDQAIKSNDLLKNPVLTSDNLPKDANGKTVLDRIDSAPTAYRWSMRLPWIFGGLAVLGGVLLFVFSWPYWRTSLQRAGRILLGIGVTLLVVAGLTRLFVAFATQPNGLASKLSGGQFKDVAVSFVSALEKAYDTRVLIFAVVYLAAAAVILIALRFLKPAPSATATPKPLNGARR